MRIDFGSPLAELCRRPQPRPAGVPVRDFAVVLLFIGEEVAFDIGEAGIEQTGILSPDREGQAGVKRMQVHEVPQDVTLDGLNEGLTTTLQALEEIGAAEAHQPLSGATSRG